MKNVSLLVLVLLPFAGCRLPHWQPFALDERVVVELPGQPRAMAPQVFTKLTHPERSKAWALRTLGGTYHLLRTANPAAHFGAHEGRDREAYYDRLERALRKRKAQIVTTRSFTIAGITGREVVYNSHATQVPTLIYSRVLALDTVSYSLNFIPAYPAGVLALPGTAQRRLFFQSINLIAGGLNR